MPNVDRFMPGELCWIELATTDREAAKRFYADLFGWAADERPMEGDGGAGGYSLMKLAGRDVCGLYQLDAQHMRGIPPHWGLYVSVEDVDAALKRASELGAEPLCAPLDVSDLGRMATVKDPTGAVLNLWQARKHKGAGVVRDPGTLAWAELDTRDVEAAKRFYPALFGWGVAGSPEYVEWTRGEQHIGGMMELGPQMADVPPNWLVYFGTRDCAETVRSAERLGARVLVPDTPIPNAGRFAVLADPQDAVFAVYQET